MTDKARLRPVVLCVLDGLGLRAEAPDNAVSLARMPNLKGAMASCLSAQLEASGEAVGLPFGQMGNSEVGHMNLGAGRVVYQELPRIDRAIEKNELAQNPALQAFIAKLKVSGGTCHLMGLASPGGVHAHERHMLALARLVAGAGVRVKVHAFLDGRDVPPQSAEATIPAFAAALPEGARLATLCGRYFAMDRDKRWERVRKAYDLLAEGKGAPGTDPAAVLAASYKAGVGDEFIEPVCLDGYHGMEDGDGLLFANFRTDRAREILEALVLPAFDAFPRKRKVAFAAALGMVSYEAALDPFLPALFAPAKLEGGLGELVAEAGLKQLRIAETEKYPHVTFFFNGGREEPYPGETRVMVPSPKVATYDLAPAMSAFEVTDRVVEALHGGTFDLIVLNYANPDMVGHTGVLSAAVQALDVLDACLGRLIEAVRRAGGALLLTADHGNCEMMVDAATGGPHTAHTTDPVPVVLLGAPQGVTGLKNGKLADVAPTILELMGLPKPAAMDGVCLLVRA